MAREHNETGLRPTKFIQVILFRSFLYSTLVCLLMIACNNQSKKIAETPNIKPPTYELQVLGTLQDGGSPHAGCKKACCEKLFQNPDPNRMVVCLGLSDRENNHLWMFEAGPDLGRQQKLLYNDLCMPHKENADGIFITHAHIGHYAGLMYLGKEAMDAESVPVYAMPRLKNYLETNGPWIQLVNRKNIALIEMKADSAIYLSDKLKVIPMPVPHRDEFSETVGFKIIGPNKSALFIPDIDKWEKWDKDIVEEIQKVDYAFIDATFFDAEEINHRNIKDIPHPFVIESMQKFKDLNNKEKSKIYFIHLNHSNPLLDSSSAAYKTVMHNGFHVAKFKEKFGM